MHRAGRVEGKAAVLIPDTPQKAPLGAKASGVEDGCCVCFSISQVAF